MRVSNAAIYLIGKAHHRKKIPKERQTASLNQHLKPFNI